MSIILDEIILDVVNLDKPKFLLLSVTYMCSLLALYVVF